MKTILFVEHGFEIKEYAFGAAKELGVRVLVATNIVADNLLEYVRREDIIVTDVFSSHQLIIDVVAHLSSRGIRIDGVGTFRENAVITTADLADALSLPGVGGGPARRSSQNKLLMRESLRWSDFKSQPKYRFINIFSENALNDIRNFPKPCVIKPLFGTASHGVRKIAEGDNIESIINSLIKVISPESREIFSLFKGDMLLEEYVAGTLLSIDGFVVDGGVIFVGSTEFIMGNEPNFTQVASFIPSRLSKESQKMCEDTVRDIIARLGFKTSGFHCELRITDNQVSLIEIASRLPGGGIHRTYQKVYGIDLVKTMITLWLGGKKEDVKYHAPAGVNYHKMVYADQNQIETLENLDGIPALGESSLVWDYGRFVQSGDILPWYPMVPQPLYYYAVFSKDAESAEKVALDFESHITYTLKNFE